MGGSLLGFGHGCTDDLGDWRRARGGLVFCDGAVVGGLDEATLAQVITAEDGHRFTQP